MKQNELGKIVQPLLDWYHANARVLPWRENKQPYRVWVSEIMLQQTRVEPVIPYYERFMEHFPTVFDLANAGEEELMKLWEGLGYYSRARNLQKAARMICDEFDGKFPEDFELILKLPGIGNYTAGAISSIAFEKARAAVDGNVLRVVTRLTEDSSDIMEEGFRRKVTGALEQVYPATMRGDFTQSLMELGALVCLPNGEPRCSVCPLNELCGAYASQNVMAYPVKKKKTERKIEKKTVLILCKDEKIALHKRDHKGVLANMWELPNIEGKLTMSQLKKWLKKQGIAFSQIEEFVEKKHIFSHIEWHMNSFVVQCNEVPEELEWEWESRKDIDEQFALPKAFKIILDNF
ncbi:MAG: A/G-specific adenine glycosylase [Lachnospiraceae bacterium]